MTITLLIGLAVALIVALMLAHKGRELSVIKEVSVIPLPGTVKDIKQAISYEYSTYTPSFKSVVRLNNDSVKELESICDSACQFEAEGIRSQHFLFNQYCAENIINPEVLCASAEIERIVSAGGTALLIVKDCVC